MKIENTQTFGFETSMRAMRNPLNSWVRSDNDYYDPYDAYDSEIRGDWNNEGFILGNKDAKLSRNLSKSGSDHRKHLRLIRVWTDMTLPRYIWSEMDTYRHIDKISCSTMHKLMSRPLTSQDFDRCAVLPETLSKLNSLIDEYKDTTSKYDKNEILIECKDYLPESFLQKRTISTNYECLLTIYLQRRNHRLPQWHTICDWILNLPYFSELTGVEYGEA